MKLSIMALWALGLILFAGSILVWASVTTNKTDIYTLYRSSTVIEEARIHVATFDVIDDQFGYNKENCSLAAKLFKRQPDTEVSFWCESGRFKWEE